MTRTFALRIGNLNNLSFLIGAISPAGELSIVFLLMKIPMLLRLAWRRSGRWRTRGQTAVSDLGL